MQAHEVKPGNSSKLFHHKNRKLIELAKRLPSSIFFFFFWLFRCVCRVKISFFLPCHLCVLCWLCLDRFYDFSGWLLILAQCHLGEHTFQCATADLSGISSLTGLKLDLLYYIFQGLRIKSLENKKCFAREKLFMSWHICQNFSLIKKVNNSQWKK